MVSVDWYGLALFIGGLSFAFVIGVLLARNAVRTALKTELKTNAVEKIFETMGFKNFKLKDLNTSNLDDKGFDRFRVMLYDIGKLYGQTGAGGGTSSALAQAASILQQFGAQNQAQKTQTPNNLDAGVQAQ